MFAELIKAGEIDQALEHAKSGVRKQPASALARIDLMHAFILFENWGKAHDQAKVFGQLDPKQIESSQSYQILIEAEQQRAAVFAGRQRPNSIGEPQNWIAYMAEALRLLGDGQHAAAAELRARAFDEAPASAGEVNGEAFEWIADADQRLGPILEVFRQGQYLWAPWTEIASVEASPPVTLMDLVWFPVQIEWKSGHSSAVVIPARYPAGPGYLDARYRLVKATDFIEDESSELTIGVGQKLLCHSGGDVQIFELRSVSFPTAAR